jgi:hypothetical protein
MRKWIDRNGSAGLFDNPVRGFSIYILSPLSRETERQIERERERGGGEEEEEEEKRSKTKTKALLRCGTGMPIEN